MKQAPRRCICLAVMLTLMLGCFTTVSFAAGSSTKKMTTYTDCIKSGNYVYCNGSDGIYKVNIKNNKKSCVVKVADPEIQCVVSMKLNKGYIYYAIGEYPEKVILCRVKTSGKSNKKLASFYEDGIFPRYAISGSKIYYRGYKDYDCTKVLKMKMKLNGKSKSKTSCNVKTKYVKSNKSGYRRATTEDGHYLKKPNGKMILLSKIDD